MLDIGTSSVKRVRIEGMPENISFVPTDIEVDGDRVLVANYAANNLLVFRKSPDAAALVFSGTFGNEESISPERRGYRFRSGRRYQLRRTQRAAFSLSDLHAPPCGILPVKLAHGLVPTEWLAYATSLNDRTVVKIDPYDCKTLAVSGGQGCEPCQYLWPVTVDVWDLDHVAISDAHTRRITVLDSNNLKVTITFLSYDPGADQVNMPYGFRVQGDKVYVTSTFGNSLLRLEKEKGAPVERWKRDTNRPELGWFEPYNI